MQNLNRSNDNSKYLLKLGEFEEEEEKKKYS